MVLKEVPDCILNNNEETLKKIDPYIHSQWRDLHVPSGCVCIDENIAIPNILREALKDNLHASHQSTWRLRCMATHCWWPYMNGELMVRSTECNLCKTIGKSLKAVIPGKQFQPHIHFFELNQEIQIDFGGPNYDVKGHENIFSP